MDMMSITRNKESKFPFALKIDWNEILFYVGTFSISLILAFSLESMGINLFS